MHLSWLGHHHYWSEYLDKACLGVWLLLKVVAPEQAIAQVIPDLTLPTPASVSTDNNNNTFHISAGTEVGNNLFLSFEQFSLPTGSSAIFEVNPTVETLLSRVTGSSPSDIDGIIQVDGSADFFLINPNGIVFGPNANLDIGGSFVATTAEHVEFSEGIFSSKEIDSTSLLSLETPIGLQFGQNPGPITNFSGNASSATNRNGLQIQPHQTLALIGGAIEIPGGQIISPQSHIELGSVAGESFVGIATTGSRVEMNYDEVKSFRDIQISQLASIDSSGAGGGLIKLQGRDISVIKGAQILSNTELNQDGQGIFLKASAILEIVGTGPVDGPIDKILFEAIEVQTPQRSSISANTLRQTTGNGGDINIQAQQVTIRDGGDISARALGLGRGGDVSVIASELVEVAGNAQFLGLSDRLSIVAKDLGIPEELIGGAFSASFIVATSDSSGPSGDITIDTKKVLIRDGGNIAANPLSQGTGGNITILATQAVELSGVSINEAYSPGITIGPIPNVEGIPGKLTITSPKLSITGGSGIGLSTSTPVGATGVFNISEEVRIIGTSPSGALPSSISALSARNGKGGSVELTTKELLIADGATITAIGENSSQGGDINLIANFVIIDNQSSITTSVDGQTEGIGGNVNLKVEDVLLLRRDSEVSARSGSDGRGGNIEIEADFIVAVPNENSDIVADAVRGQGGKIHLVTNGILGLEVRELPTPKSNDISASSELGLDGTVTVDSPDTELNPGEIELNDQVKTPYLAQGCLAALSEQSSFVLTGRGGLPANPASPVSADGLWEDLEPLSNLGFEQQVARSPIHLLTPDLWPIKSALKEAINWQVDSNGEVRLIEQKEASLLEFSTALTCSSN